MENDECEEKFSEIIKRLIAQKESEIQSFNGESIHEDSSAVPKQGSPGTIVGSSSGSNSPDKKTRQRGLGFRFLRVIKRRFKFAVGKEPPCGCVPESGSDTEPSGSEGMIKDETNKDPEEITSGIYIAAKKHLSEMVANGGINVNSPSKEVPIILGRILSLPEFSSPVLTPRRVPEIHSDEHSKLLGSCSSDLIDEESVPEDVSEGHEGDGDKEPLKQETSVKESSIDVLGKLSPVSVLDPPFTDDDFVPKGSRSHPGEIRMRPLCIRFDEPCSPKSDQDRDINMTTSMDDKESTLACIKAVVKASGLDSDKFLEPASMDDIEFCSNQLCDDKKLLFDCINEVLMEFCGGEFDSFPWISSMKPTVWLMSEIEKEVYWHLLPLPVPRTLDHIVRKDLERTGKWMDIGYEIGCVCIETGEIILHEILEGIIRNCLDCNF